MFRLLSIITAAFALTLVTGRAETACQNIMQPDSVAADGHGAALPELSAYEFCFMYVSTVADEFNASDSVCDFLFGNPSIMTVELPAHDGFKAPYAAADITVEKFGAADSATYVWTLPAPGEPPLPLMIAFTPDRNGRYHTIYLEKSIMAPWILGTMEFEDRRPSHRSLMPVLQTPADAEEFAGMAARAVARRQPQP